MNVRSLAVPLLAVAAGCGSPTATPSDLAGSPDMTTGSDTLVMTAQGALMGVSEGATRVFRGIPYAAPPVGANRFRSPQPPVAWQGVRDASMFGPKCPQLALTGGGYDATTSEDCLTLNVWAPAGAGTPRPVMVFIHGGGFVSGSGSEILYNGENLSQAGDVVVVTLNYRLGPLGFLALPSLDGEDPAHATSGNYGIEDQTAALKWVSANVAAFGGDPANVTLFGESAGGASTCVQLVAPASAPFIHRAIVESGLCTLIAPTHAQVLAAGQALAKATGCDGGDATAQRACLRALTAKQVSTALPLHAGLLFGDGASWTPNVDGVVVPAAPAKLFAEGKEAKVPLIVGANFDEGTLFFALAGNDIDEPTLRGALLGFLSGAQADKVLAQYPVANYASANDQGIHVLDDMILCDARRVARAHVAAGNEVYYYDFKHPFKFLYPNLGAFHSAELPFVFGNAYEGIFALAPEEEPLSKAMQGYWTAFATAGSPDGAMPPPAVAWPRYAAATDQDLSLDVTIAAESDLRKKACDFWDAL